VQVWTIDDPNEMRQFKNDKEVDAIMTDDPALLESVINE
jgi:glycerophosphoryl diester phosphodiesterase